MSYSSEMANKSYKRTATISLQKEDWKRIDTIKKQLLEKEPSTTSAVKHALKVTVEK
jgi:hypothetical protein